MSLTTIICAWCGGGHELENSHINRSQRVGMALYCSRKCSGLGRRDTRTTEQRKADKAVYDQEYRAKNLNRIRARKAAAWQKNKPEWYARHRVRMDSDPEYRAKYKAVQARCQARPEWKEHKRQYDRVRLAKHYYGEFWESALIIREIDAEVDRRVPEDHRLQALKGTLNKAQTRKKRWKRNQI